MTPFKTKFITKETLPLVIEPNEGYENISAEEFYKHLSDHKEHLQMQLLQHGGLLFRGFPLNNEDDFLAVIKHLELGKFIDYVGGDSPRTKIKEGVYTSTEAPPGLKIALHNELSFVKNYPKHIYFFCQVPPVDRGETIIADARKVYQTMQKDVRERFESNELRYISRYYNNSKLIDYLNSIRPAHKTWMNVFETDSKSRVEELCKENEFEFRWTKENWIELIQERPAVLTHPTTNETVWFNQAHLFDFNPKFLGWWRYLGAKLLYCRKHMKLHDIYYKNKQKISKKDIYHVLDTLDQNTISFPWEKGDVMVLDNVLTMHGRAPFSGKRRILTAMTS